ncbi:MAG: hypothetical protein J0665_14325 [Deltaproteobacteria bacterium]|nr:hypothetical protein [Deltaproteobacteria bacterium]
MGNLIAVGIAFLVVFSIIGLMGEMGLNCIIITLIGGGAGYALGSLANIGWGIFGAVLGALISVAIEKRIRKR